MDSCEEETALKKRRSESPSSLGSLEIKKHQFPALEVEDDDVESIDLEHKSPISPSSNSSLSSISLPPDVDHYPHSSSLSSPSFSKSERLSTRKTPELKSSIFWNSEEEEILLNFCKENKGKPASMIAASNRLKEAGFNRSAPGCYQKCMKWIKSRNSEIRAIAIASKPLFPPAAETRKAQRRETSHQTSSSDKNYSFWSEEELNVLLDLCRSSQTSTVSMRTASSLLQRAGYDRTPSACFNKIAKLKKSKDSKIQDLIGSITTAEEEPEERKGKERGTEKEREKGRERESQNEDSGVSQYGTRSSISFNRDISSVEGKSSNGNESHLWSKDELMILLHAVAIDGCNGYASIARRLASLGYYRTPGGCRTKLAATQWDKKSFQEEMFTDPTLVVAIGGGLLCGQRQLLLVELSDFFRYIDDGGGGGKKNPDGYLNEMKNYS